MKANLNIFKNKSRKNETYNMKYQKDILTVGCLTCNLVQNSGLLAVGILNQDNRRYQSLR